MLLEIVCRCGGSHKRASFRRLRRLRFLLLLLTEYSNDLLKRIRLLRLRLGPLLLLSLSGWFGTAQEIL